MYEPILPREDHCMASASYNGSIFMIGGYLYTRQMTEYVISDNIMLDRGETILSIDIYQSGCVYYNQYGNVLNILSQNDHEIIVYNLESPNFINNTDSIITPNNFTYGPGSCVTSNEEYLVISGGFNGGYLDTLALLILDNHTWVIGALPSWQADHGCIVIFDAFYIIGGIGEDSVHKIAISNIMNVSYWYRIGNFTTVLKQPHCVLHNNLIWIIGGIDQNSVVLDTVYTVNVMNDNVALLDEALPYGVYGSATVITDDILYVFGGVINRSSTTETNTWMKYNITPVASTLTPTFDPSESKIHIVVDHPSATLFMATTTDENEPSLSGPEPNDKVNEKQRNNVLYTAAIILIILCSVLFVVVIVSSVALIIYRHRQKVKSDVAYLNQSQKNSAPASTPASKKHDNDIDGKRDGVAVQVRDSKKVIKRVSDVQLTSEGEANNMRNNNEDPEEMDPDIEDMFDENLKVKDNTNNTIISDDGENKHDRDIDGKSDGVAVQVRDSKKGIKRVSDVQLTSEGDTNIVRNNNEDLEEMDIEDMFDENLKVKDNTITSDDGGNNTN